MVLASDTSNGSGPEFCVTQPPSTKSFSMTMSLITALYLQERSPNPRSESQVQVIPIPRVNRAAPSGKSFTFLKLPGFSGLEASLSSFARFWWMPHCQEQRNAHSSEESAITRKWR